MRTIKAVIGTVQERPKADYAPVVFALPADYNLAMDPGFMVDQPIVYQEGRTVTVFIKRER